jgi:DNA-binding NtrC family response regulator
MRSAINDHPVPDPAARILVVDDEPEVRSVLADGLSAVGYAVLQAQSALEALVVIGESPPDVILLDITMGEVDGVQALRGFRALAPHVPIIMLTGNADVEVARATLRLGAFDYIAKPYDLEHLREVVAAAVAHGGA